MTKHNICKLIESSEKEPITAKWFVCERKHEVMKEKRRLGTNRALLVSLGEASVMTDGKPTQASKGELIFVFSGEEFYVVPGDECEYMYIDFVGSRCAELFRRFGITEGNRLFCGHEGLIPFWLDALSRAGESNADLVAESVLLYTLSQLAEASERCDGITEQILHIIEEEYTDPSLSVASVAAGMGYNSKYISHRFKENVGVGFSEYLRNLRIKHAVFLIDHGLESVKNIALLCGFSDPLYFSAVFKRAVGASPTDYMRRDEV